MFVFRRVRALIEIFGFLISVVTISNIFINVISCHTGRRSRTRPFPCEHNPNLSSSQKPPFAFFPVGDQLPGLQQVFQVNMLQHPTSAASTASTLDSSASPPVLTPPRVIKRRSSSASVVLPVETVASLLSCRGCHLCFSGTVIPRSFVCGCTLCSACIDRLLVPPPPPLDSQCLDDHADSAAASTASSSSASSDSASDTDSLQSASVKCPDCGALVAFPPTGSAALPVSTLALRVMDALRGGGGDLFPIDVWGYNVGIVATLLATGDTKVLELKEMLRTSANDGRNRYNVRCVSLALVGEMQYTDQGAGTCDITRLDQDERTLASFGIVNKCTLNVFVHCDVFNGGEHILQFGQNPFLVETTGSANCLVPLRCPRGLALSHDGAFLFVVEAETSQISGGAAAILKLCARTGQVVQRFRTNFCRGTGPHSLDAPASVCLSVSGKLLFVTDVTLGTLDSGRVHVFDAHNGSLLYDIPLYGFGGSGAGGIAAGLSSDGSELLYVADSDNNRVVVVRIADSQQVQFIGSGAGAADGQMRSPHGLCLVGHTLFVADSGNNRVQAFHIDAPNASHSHQYSVGALGNRAGQFNEPTNVTVTPDGQLLCVVDANNNRVQVLRASDGKHVHTMGSAGLGAGQLMRPFGIAVSQSHKCLFVSSHLDGRILGVSMPAANEFDAHEIEPECLDVALPAAGNDAHAIAP